jgi:alpha-D-ribose 1-methylphosphonate 5-triphosphate synthase subunit PhnH
MNIIKSTSALLQENTSDKDIAERNRYNFRACLNALSSPGSRQPFLPLFDSSIMALASVLLYAEVTYCYEGEYKDFQLIKKMTGARYDQPATSDYIFADHPDPILLAYAHPGTMETPETSATCIFKTMQPSNRGIDVRLSIPRAKKKLTTVLPIPRSFLDQLIDKKYPFPLGVDMLLITKDDQLIALPRTTGIEITQ